MQPMPHTLYDLPEIEYLDGVPHPKVCPKLTHSLVQAALVHMLREASGDRGFVLPELRVDAGASNHSKTEFVPDVAWISRSRLTQLQGEQREKPPFSPDIAIEVRSPSDDPAYLAQKIARYLATGSTLVLDVEPEKRRITAHSAAGVRTYASGETFAHPAFDWLRFNVADVFQDLDRLP